MLQYKELYFKKLTKYMTSVQPSSVTHVNTVNPANPMLSKLVIPKFGPFQTFSQLVPGGHWKPNLSLVLQGCGSS